MVAALRCYGYAATHWFRQADGFFISIGTTWKKTDSLLTAPP
jgi:hypothetical protein